MHTLMRLSLLRCLVRVTSAARCAHILALLLVVGSGGCSRQQHVQTTLFVVRHAEYTEDRTDDPDLSEAGAMRAGQLERLLSRVDIDAVYATQFARTQQTAEPVARRRNLPVRVIDADESESVIEKIASDHGGERVLVVGHADTVPTMVRRLGGKLDPGMRFSRNDDLFVVTLAGSGEARVLHLKYGDPVQRQ